ncbi:MAG: hypothetical protein E7265_11450 [Lachnospiraceae bacterium]|nr:hypothetical protein [Lachnospiraceae bacterium]
MDNALSNVFACEYGKDKAELKNAKLLYILMSVFLIVDWSLPSYFGIHIGFDFTGTRILNMIILLYFVLNRTAGNHFLRSMLELQVTPYLALYMFVMIYTTVLRVNVNTFFLNFLDIITFYMVYYGIRYLIGVKKAIDWTVKFAWVIGIYGLIEYILGFSPMLKFMMTLPSAVRVVFRSGQYRVFGPCAHSIAYGLLLLILIAIACMDYEKDEMYLFKRPALLGLLLVNLFLTGSRGPLGFAFAEMFLIILLSKSERRKKTLFYLIVFVIVVVACELVLIKTSVGQYIMMQFTSVIDEVFGTSYAVNYGADTTWLNQSSSYREHLPRIFTVGWLNPMLGLGANASIPFQFEDVTIRSIDNFYVASYVRYGYPGLISFGLFQIMSIIYPLRTAIKHRSGISMVVAIAITIYSISLYWVDYLHTTKYMYILLAIYCAHYSDKFADRDVKNN